MTRTRSSLAIALSLVCMAQPALAQSDVKLEHANRPGPEAPAAVQGPHGGVLHNANAVQFETVLERGGIRVYVYDHAGQPIDTRGARGLATLHAAGAAKRYRYDLFAEAARDEPAESLGVAVDLTRLVGQQVSVDVHIVGLPHSARRGVAFSSVAHMPMTPQQVEAAAIARQQVCPVSSQPLGSMGQPIAVTVGIQTVYVCCQSCVDAVRENPGKYVERLPQNAPVRATEADTVAIAAQKVCPVMDEPLGSMGTPLKVTVRGRDVFVCCQGCVKLLLRDPDKYLATLPAADPSSDNGK